MERLKGFLASDRGKEFMRQEDRRHKAGKQSTQTDPTPSTSSRAEPGPSQQGVQVTIHGSTVQLPNFTMRNHCYAYRWEEPASRRLQEASRAYLRSAARIVSVTCTMKKAGLPPSMTSWNRGKWRIGSKLRHVSETSVCCRLLDCTCTYVVMPDLGNHRTWDRERAIQQMCKKLTEDMRAIKNLVIETRDFAEVNQR